MALHARLALKSCGHHFQSKVGFRTIAMDARMSSVLVRFIDQNKVGGLQGTFHFLLDSRVDCRRRRRRRRRLLLRIIALRLASFGRDI